MFLSSIFPNRIVTRYVGQGRHISQKYFDDKFKKSQISKANLKIKKSSFNLSRQSQSKIRDSINLLHELSKPRSVWVNSKKKIYNFRCSFITLTLPSEQEHADLEIKKCLNNFLVRLRQTYEVKNYVWKAELQQNQNIHFHLIIDQYVPHRAIRYYWNLAINTLGYVDRYRQKMENLSLSEYAELRGKSVASSLSSFLAGVKSNWASPPTEQCVSVRSKQQLAVYLSKYLTKPTQTKSSKINKESSKSHISIAHLVRVRSFGRVWARSQSLSRIKNITRWSWDDIREMLEQFENWREMFTHKVYDYCEIWYINFRKATPHFLRIIRRIIRDLGISYNYPFPV